MSSQYTKRKAKEKKADPVEELLPVNPAEPVEMRKAYDVFYDTSIRRFVQVCIEYDLTSGKGVVTEAINVADSQPVAIQKLGILFSKKILNIK